MADTDQDRVPTYREVTDCLLGLSDDQLAQAVKTVYIEETEVPVHIIVRGIFIAEEDQVNPSGDGWEPKSTYESYPEYADEPVVARKGEVFLMIEAKRAGHR